MTGLVDAYKWCMDLLNEAHATQKSIKDIEARRLSLKQQCVALRNEVEATITAQCKLV